MGLFILLRRIERWLHQHIFKVGWLVTRDFQATTILYYAFFFPGVFLHEFTYWLSAGALNVRAKVEIPFLKKEVKDPKQAKQSKSNPVPETPPQTTIDLSKLKPDFVTLEFGRGRRKKGLYRKGIIAVAPLLVALVCIWLVADRIFNIMDVVATMSSGELPDIARGFGILTGAPNFWLWIYIVFTIANTMFPPVPDELKGWKTVALTGVAVSLALTFIGIGGEIFEALQTPFSSLISVMLVTLILIICIDVVMVLVLGLIEYTIEHFSGHTATFRGDTMEVMTREEAIAYFEREEEKQRKAEEKQIRQRAKAADTGPASVYLLTFPIPGAPGEIPITPVREVVEEAPEVVEQEELEPLSPAARQPMRESSQEFAARINIPERRSLAPKRPEIAADDESDEAVVRPAASLRERIAPVPRPSITPDIQSDDDDEEQVRPAASAFVRKPISLVPDADDESGAEAEEVAASVVRKPISLTPATSFRTINDDSDDVTEDDEVEEQPIFVARQSTVSPTVQAPESVDIEDENDEEEIQERVIGRPAPIAKSILGTQSTESDDISEDEDEEEISEAQAPLVAPHSRFGQSSIMPESVDVDSEEDTDEEDEVEEEASDIPTASSTTASRFSVRPFGSPATVEKDEDSDDESSTAEPAASISSRFGTSRFRRFSATDGDDVEETKSVSQEPAKPKGILSTKSDAEDDSPSEPAASVSSRFGISPFRRNTSDESKTESEEKSTPISLEPAKPKGILSSPLLDDDDDNEDTGSKSAAALRSRFGTASFRSVSDVEDEEEATEAEEKSQFANLSPAKPKGIFQQTSDDDDEDERPTFSRGTSRLGTSPFSSRVPVEEEDEEDDEEESILRRGRGSDAVSDLFGGLSLNSSTDDDNEEDDLDEKLDNRFSRFGSSSTPSRFGNRASVIGRSTAHNDEYDYEDDEEYIDDDDDYTDYADDDEEYYDSDDD